MGSVGVGLQARSAFHIARHYAGVASIESSITIPPSYLRKIGTSDSNDTMNNTPLHVTSVVMNGGESPERDLHATYMITAESIMWNNTTATCAHTNVLRDMVFSGILYEVRSYALGICVGVGGEG